MSFFWQYVWKSHQGSPVTLGYLNSIGALGQLFVSPQLGKLGDTFGARAVMMAGCISMAMCHVTTGLAWGLVFLFLGRMFAIAQDPKPGRLFHMDCYVLPNVLHGLLCIAVYYNILHYFTVAYLFLYFDHTNTLEIMPHCWSYEALDCQIVCITSSPPK